MAEPAWIIKWRARDLLKNGQPEEAHRLLDDLIATGNRRAFALRSDVVTGYLDRAERLLKQHDVEAAWSVLNRVEELAVTDSKVIRLRETLTNMGLAEIRGSLATGNALNAVQAVSRLKERPVRCPELGPLEEAAHEWVLAIEMAERGDYQLAHSAIERIRRRLDGRSSGLDRFEQDVARREDRYRSAWQELQDAVAANDGRATLRTADEVLAVAPRHKDAQQARNRAWQTVQAETTPYRPRDEELASTNNSMLAPTVENIEVVREQEATVPKRYILWIDGIGAWLVCLGPRITIGQASPEGGPIDVPLLADVSRIHASLTRDDESYMLETSREASVNGRAVSKTVLQSGDQLMFASCAMNFQLPVPGCLSAKLTFAGNRRLPMAVDGILLMADLLVLGSGDKVHVHMPTLDKPIYLFRQKDSLGVRWSGAFVVEGQNFKDRALLPVQGCVSSNEFAFAIEPLGR